MKSKYDGIDIREIKCCDESETNIEAGISFERDEEQNILRFHFLDYIKYCKHGELDEPILNQFTKSMFLNYENTTELIKELKELNFGDIQEQKIVLELTPLQVWFLKHAIELREYVLPLNKESLTASEFRKDYGVSKRQVNAEIDNLQLKIDEWK